jgi:hypothetical protein
LTLDHGCLLSLGRRLRALLDRGFAPERFRLTGCIAADCCAGRIRAGSRHGDGHGHWHGRSGGSRDSRLWKGAPLLITLLEALVRRLAYRRAPDWHPHDIALDDEVIGAAEHHEMLYIVPPQENQLPLPVEIIDIDDAKARLSPATALLSGRGKTLSADAPEHDGKKCEKSSNDRERDHILDDGRYFKAEH